MFPNPFYSHSEWTKEWGQVKTYYRWKKQYGGMKAPDAKRLKILEWENVQLKKLVADLSLDNSMLKEIARGNF